MGIRDRDRRRCDQEVAPQPSAEERPARAEFLVRGMRVITTVTALQDLLEREKGVERVQVNADTERATIDYIAGLTTPDDLAQAIRQAGFKAEPVTETEEMEDQGADSRESELADVTRRFLIAVVLTVPLTIAAMWHLFADMPGGRSDVSSTLAPTRWCSSSSPSLSSSTAVGAFSRAPGTRCVTAPPT